MPEPHDGTVSDSEMDRDTVTFLADHVDAKLSTLVADSKIVNGPLILLLVEKEFGFVSKCPKSFGDNVRTDIEYSIMSSQMEPSSNCDGWEVYDCDAVVDGIPLRFVAYRTAEGRVLQGELSSYIGNIRTLLGQVEPFEKARVDQIKERMRKNLVEADVKVDENRFEQEIIFYLEKLDVTEEKVRLGLHLDYFLKTMEHEADCGKKLGFIAQEIGREINTLGSKSNQPDMQKIVVRMKDELEKIKEQSLNVL